MLHESSKDALLSKANNNDIWHANDFWEYLTLNALSLSFTIYNTLNNIGKWQNLQQEKISVGRKRIFKKLSLLFFGVNINVYKRTSLQALWRMLQPLKHWRKVVLSSINIKKWFLNLIRGITVILSNHFIHWNIIQKCWNWKPVGIYNGKLTLNSKISLVQLREQRFLKCLGIFFSQPLVLSPIFQPWAP